MCVLRIKTFSVDKTKRGNLLYHRTFIYNRTPRRHNLLDHRTFLYNQTPPNIIPRIKSPGAGSPFWLLWKIFNIQILNIEHQTLGVEQHPIGWMGNCVCDFPACFNSSKGYESWIIGNSITNKLSTLGFSLHKNLKPNITLTNIPKSPLHLQILTWVLNSIRTKDSKTIN